MGSSWIFDIDGHVMEPPEVWETLPARFHDYIPRRVEYPSGHRVVVGERLSFLRPRESFAGLGSVVTDDAESVSEPTPAESPYRPGGSDPAARLVDMDAEGIDIAVLFPTIALIVYSVSERDAQHAICRAINDWLGRYQAHAPDRLIGVGMLPGNPDDALAEARRCVDTLGFRGVWRRPETCAGLPALHAPDYDDLWRYLAQADVPFFVHPGYNGVVRQEYFAERFGDYYLPGHAAHFPVEQMMALSSFVCYGVLERHPTLRVGLVETGALWALYYVHRLDEHLETWATNTTLEHDASYYFRRQCLVSVEDAEPGLAAMLERFPESVAFASDYPHPDATFPGAPTSLLETSALTDAQRRSVLSDNARRFIGR